MTYKTIKDVVLEHAAQDTFYTGDGIRMLELQRLRHDYPGTVNGAANLYITALSIIREMQKAAKKPLCATPSPYDCGGNPTKEYPGE